MNSSAQRIENRNRVDSAMQTLLLDTREIVCELVKPLAAQGRFSLEDIPEDRRGRLRTVDDIARTMDPTALLAVLGACTDDRYGPSLLEIPGVNFRFVDKVRRIRNDHAHGDGDYTDSDYVLDAVNATNDLRARLLHAGSGYTYTSTDLEPAEVEDPFTLRTLAFFDSLSRGNSGLALSLVPRGIYTGYVNDDGLTPMHQAIKEAPQRPRGTNYLNIVEKLIASGAYVDAKSSQGETALYLAVRLGKVEIAEVLIENGAGFNARGTDGETILNLAVSQGHLGVVKTLIDHGIDVNVRPFGIEPALNVAARLNHAEIAEALLSAGADLNVESRDSRIPTATQVAASYGNLEVLKTLLAAGADVNSRSPSGQSLLHLASQKGNLPMAKVLIAAGADVNTADENGSTILDESARRGDAAMVDALAVGADATVIDEARRTLKRTRTQQKTRRKIIKAAYIAVPIIVAIVILLGARGRLLLLAVENNHIDATKALIFVGTDVNSKDRFDNTPLYKAVANSEMEMVKALLAAGADPDVFNSQGSSPLIRAIYNNSTDMVDLLLQAGADVNSGNFRGTPLHRAVITGRPSMVSQLIDAGAYINAGDPEGDTAIHNITRTANVNNPKVEEILALLLSAGANINAKNASGETVLHRMKFEAYGEARSLRKLIETLLSAGADVNARDSGGNTPLHSAIVATRTQIPPENRYELVDALIAGGAETNARDADDFTPLHIAAGTRFEGITPLLLSSGAEVDARTNLDATPLIALTSLLDPSYHVYSYLSGGDNYEAIDALIGAGADVNASDDFGNTPLHFSFNIRHGSEQAEYVEGIVDRLIAGGADIYAVNDAGQTAQDIANETGWGGIYR